MPSRAGADHRLAAYGDAVRSAIAAYLDSEPFAQLTGPARLKFLSEALLAATVDGPESLQLRQRLSELLFTREVEAMLHANPLTLASFAIPLAYAPARQPLIPGLRQLYAAIHGSGALAMPSYPEYRNRELDFVAARLSGERYGHDPFAAVATSLPWMTRDQIYALTHIHFYNSDFGCHTVRYGAAVPAMLELLVLLARARGDVDLMLELMICYASVEGGDPAIAARHHSWAADRIECFEGWLGDPERFAARYHPCFVAWLYGNASQRSVLAGMPDDGSCHDAHDALAEMLARSGAGDGLTILAAYTDHCDSHPPHPALEACLPLMGRVLSFSTRCRHRRQLGPDTASTARSGSRNASLLAATS